MSKKFKPQVPTEKEPHLDMSSMIDVSFLLLIFFLITSTLDPKESDPGMALPTRDNLRNNPDPDPIDPMAITIQADGSIFVDGKTLDRDINRRNLPLLDDKLAQYKTASDLLSTIPLVSVTANDDVPGQRFIDVLNSLAKVDIKNVIIADVTNE